MRIHTCKHIHSHQLVCNGEITSLLVGWVQLPHETPKYFVMIQHYTLAVSFLSHAAPSPSFVAWSPLCGRWLGASERLLIQWIFILLDHTLTISHSSTHAMIPIVFVPPHPPHCNMSSGVQSRTLFLHTTAIYEPLNTATIHEWTLAYGLYTVIQHKSSILNTYICDSTFVIDTFNMVSCITPAVCILQDTCIIVITMYLQVIARLIPMPGPWSWQMLYIYAFYDTWSILVIYPQFTAYHV